MESYVLKDLTLKLFESIFQEQEFASGPACGLALQAYLKDSEPICARSCNRAHRRRHLTMRLGATGITKRHGSKAPLADTVLAQSGTDANFERLNHSLKRGRCGRVATHNARSSERFAHAQPINLKVSLNAVWNGRSNCRPLQLGCRLREYRPVGELLFGMAYLVLAGEHFE
jgi:RHH-type proline utilization regulon transcriptional repressor/proline dehydrogenase/delta 1-pyrroline-5-carboxylate dehydrogenase